MNAMSTIRLCVFDMDGLLIDSEKIYLICALQASEIYGYGLDEELIKSTMGLNEAETIVRYREAKGNDFPIEEFFAHLQTLHEQYGHTHKLEKKKGVDELFARLDELHIRKALATSTSRLTALAYLESVKLEDCFDHIVFGDELRESKPRPEIYLKAIEPFAVAKEAILAFEDSNNGILSALNAGLKVVHIPDLAYVPEENKEKCFAVFSDLNEAISLFT